MAKHQFAILFGITALLAVMLLKSPDSLATKEQQVIKEAPEIATAASSDERSTVEASNPSTIPITRQLRTDRGWQITTCFRVSQFATSVFEDEFFREQLAAAKATKLRPFDQPDSPGVFLQLPLDQRVNRARYRCIKVRMASRHLCIAARSAERLTCKRQSEARQLAECERRAEQAHGACEAAHEKANQRCTAFWTHVHAPPRADANVEPTTTLGMEMLQAQQHCGETFHAADNSCSKLHRHSFEACSRLAHKMKGETQHRELMQLKSGCEQGAKEASQLCEEKHKAARGACASQWAATGAAGKAGIAGPMAKAWGFLMTRALHACLSYRVGAFETCQAGSQRVVATCGDHEASEDCSHTMAAAGERCKRSQDAAQDRCWAVHKNAVAATNLLVQKVAAAAASDETPTGSSSLVRSVQGIREAWKEKASTAVNRAARLAVTEARKLDQPYNIAQKAAAASAKSEALVENSLAWQAELIAGAKQMAPELDSVMAQGEAGFEAGGGGAVQG